MVWTEEDAKRERVAHILSTVRSGYSSRFGETLSTEMLLAYVCSKIEELKYEFVREAVSHLFSKSSFDCEDLFRAKNILEPAKLVTAPAPTIVSIPREKSGKRKASTVQ